MNDIQIRLFREVAGYGSFSRAEQSLYMTRQALKKHIDKLEEELGFPLFSRDNKGLVLTPAGKLFYDGIIRIDEDLENLKRRCRVRSEAGEALRIAGLEYPYLMSSSVLPQFYQEYPGVSANVSFLRHSDRVADLISSGDLDLAEGVENFRSEENGLVFSRLTSLPVRCVVSNWNPLAKKKSVSLRELDGYMLGVRSLSSSRNMTEMLEKEAGPQKIFEWDGSAQLFEFTYNLCLNNGVFLTSTMSDVPFGDLRVLPVKDAPEAEYGIYHSSNSRSCVDGLVSLMQDYAGRMAV